MESAHRQVRLGAPAQGERLLGALLRLGLDVPHECEGRGTCGTCVVLVRDGLDALAPADEDERDVLDRSGAPEASARLACRVVATGAELSIEMTRRGPPRGGGGAFGDTLPVTLSARAADFVARQLATRDAPAALRLAVRPSGCSGFGYRVEYADRIEAHDTVFESRGIRIVVDAQSLPYVRGTTIDLVREGLSRRLRFDNPNALQTCGCGESFTA